MILSARYPAAVTHRVEVSGWDKHQTFFVEKSELVGDESAGKQIQLHAAIPDGAVIFLRLLAREHRALRRRALSHRIHPHHA